MIKKKLGTKISLLVIGALIVIMGITIFIVVGKTSDMVSELTHQQAKTANDVFAATLRRYQEDAFDRAGIIAGSNEVVGAVARGDAEELEKVLENLGVGLDFITLCDSSGAVLAYVNSAQEGDGVINQQALSDSLLTGEGRGALASDDVARITACGSAPIKDATGETVGALVCGYDLTRSQYVDEIKANSGCEAVLLIGDERISTTIVDENGSRIIGTKADSAVTETVFRNRQDYYGRLKILGKMYEVYYSPLVTDGQVIGMLNTSVDIVTTLAHEQTMISGILSVAIAGVIAVSILIAMMCRILISIPLGKIGIVAQKIQNGEIVAPSYHQACIQVRSDDEVGRLTQAFNDMLCRLSDSSASLHIMQNLFNGMDAYLYVSDPWTDEVLFVNNKMKEDFWLDDDVIGKICWKVFMVDLEQRCQLCPNEKLLDNPGVPVVREGRNPITGRFYKLVDSMIEWSGGKKAHFQYGTDITDMKRAEAVLQERLKQQQLVAEILQHFNNGDDMAAFARSALQMTGQFMSVNKVFLARYLKDQGALQCLYEWSEETEHIETMGESVWLFSPDMRIYKDLVGRGHTTDYSSDDKKYPYFGEKRKKYTVLSVSVEISGELWGVLGFVSCEDQSNWTETNIYLGKHISGILSGVINRQHMREQLIEAKETAERASRAKGEFLSRMSHEMRTPLNAIIGMTSIAEGAKDIEKKDYCLDKIDSASKHLLGVINDVLDMAKIEARKFDLSYNEFNFEKMLVDVINVVDFRAEEKNQNLIVNLNKNIPGFIIGDEQRLGQVVTNLLTNAVKFTPEGGKIIINADKIDESNGVCTIRIDVADNGIGISEEQQSKLFEAFEQANGGIAREYGGTGLGLAISKEIVTRMGGEIWIESEIGQGAKFCFTIQAEKGKKQTRTILSRHINRDNMRVLAVDDSPEIRDYFRYIMKAFDLQCDVAEDGNQALLMMESHKDRPYNIFFVDWKMPHMNGIELTKKIKELTDNNAVVIMISATLWSDIEEEALSAGVNRFIPKPLFPSALVNVINECMGFTSEEVSMVKQKAAAKGYDFTGFTLLLAEDIEVNREIVQEMLSETGIRIECAENGLQALNMFEKSPGRYSLVLMDIHMSEMDGYEAVRRIRALDIPEARNVPIIAMTANVFREDIENCMEAGMNDHIGKPLNTNELYEKLDKYLKSQPVSEKENAQQEAIKLVPETELKVAPQGYAVYLPVIDVEDGVRRLQNNKKLYFSLLQRFGGRKMVDELIQNIKDDDFSKITQTAHALKGVSANLGFSALKDIAFLIEKQGKAEMKCTDLIGPLDEAVNAVSRTIQALLENEKVLPLRR